MGAAFSRAVLGVTAPRVALLSVGEEAKKGSQVVVDAHAELARLDGIDFAGNVEGRDLLTAAADVIVTDGFTGNVALKTLEGTAKTVGGAVGAAARSNPVAALGGLLMRPALGGPAARDGPRLDRWGDSARTARRGRGRARQLRSRGHRERDPPRGEIGIGAGDRTHRGTARVRGRHPRRLGELIRNRL